jgi:spermidine/putrescine-binding protein
MSTLTRSLRRGGLAAGIAVTAVVALVACGSSGGSAKASLDRKADLTKQTLTITNWANGVDYFFATNWTGATANVRGAAPMNQVAFTGFSAASTAWQSYDQQITPVPEPSTYGALLIAFAGAVTLWRRARSRPAAA